MQQIYNLLKDNKAVKKLISGKGNISTQNISEESYLLASAFCASHKNILVIKPTQHEANLLYQQLRGMDLPNVLYFPVDESQRIEAIAQSPELQAERLNTLYELCTPSSHIIISHNAGVIRQLPLPSLFRDHIISLKVGDIVDINELKKKLIKMGYQYASRVDQPFFYSNRGGIIDIYSIQYENPIRIEFFDDEVDSIRFYNKNDQRTESTIDHVTIIPASDILYEDDQKDEAIDKIQTLKNNCIGQFDAFIQDELNMSIAMDIENIRNHETGFNMYKYYSFLTDTCSLLNYIDHPIILASPYSEVQEAFKQYAIEMYNYNSELYHEGKSIMGVKLYLDLNTVLSKYNVVNNEDLDLKRDTTTFNVRSLNNIYSSEDNLVREINMYLRNNRVVMVFHNDMHVRSIMDLLERHHLKYTLISQSDPIFEGINILKANFEGGIELFDEKIVVITETELYGKQEAKKHYIRYKNAKVLSSFNELEIGDYVVHDTHGIGQYMGIKLLEVGGIKKDYLYIAYQGNDILYVPVEQFKLVRKYTSKDGRPPKIYKLNGKEWAKTKQRVRSKVDGLADELIELYAKRSQQVGYAFSPDSPLQEEFEADFPYELTPDQAISIQEIKEEMESVRPMDKLLCGDVGFGKTEVALRAAFKAILDHKQVALLCPTTILSSQHYRTITERFKNFPVNYALLNRYTSTKETNRIIKGINDGSIDFVVGTHKILNDKIEYKNLGLLIIDEEQRFGVRQKEKIKKLKENVDVLTLTATPIPRTLQMSLMGIRSLSTIDTPPSNRLPVQTYVVEKSDVLIKQVIERELARDGQVFYLHNKTASINEVANKIIKEIPGAKVGVGHGQMDKNSLEDVMNKFLNKEYNVLVCTTIIETGIDIPNANTLIVEDADHYGLSQLYQLKGRVGRSDRNAYAYLLYRKDKQMTEEAVKRLKAIKEFTQLGDGYKIAQRDLSIRGAGDILGGDQSGFIDQIGFDMYMKILQDAINEKRGIQEKEEVPITNVPVDAYVPENYVNTDLEKLELYQTVQNASSLEEIENVRSHIVDLYGKLPKSIDAIISKRIFDILMTQSYIECYEDKGKIIQVDFTEEITNRIDGIKLFELINQYSDSVKVSYLNHRINLSFKKEDRDWVQKANYLILGKDAYVK